MWFILLPTPVYQLTKKGFEKRNEASTKKGFVELTFHESIESAINSD